VIWKWGKPEPFLKTALLRTEFMHDDTVPLLTFVITLNRVKIPDSATALLWLLSSRPLQWRRNRPPVELFWQGIPALFVPHFAVVLLHFKWTRSCSLVLLVKRLFSSVYAFATIWR